MKGPGGAGGGRDQVQKKRKKMDKRRDAADTSHAPLTKGVGGGDGEGGKRDLKRKKMDKKRKHQAVEGGTEGKSELDEWDQAFNGGGAVIELLQTLKEETKKKKRTTSTVEDEEAIEAGPNFPKWGRVQQILEKRSAGGGGGGEPSKAPLKYVPLNARDAAGLESRLKEACNVKACKHFFVGVGCKRGAACKFEHTLHDSAGSASNDSDTPMPLAGGYEQGDRVKSLVDVAARKVKAGDVGTVVGPANNPKTKEAAEKVCVDFGAGKGLLNLKAEQQIERVAAGVGEGKEGGGRGGGRGVEEDEDEAEGGVAGEREGGGMKKGMTRREARREKGKLKASNKKK